MEIANKLFKDKMHDIHKRYTKRRKYIHYRQLPNRKCHKYKYLGITINAKHCSFNPTQIDLSCKATNALYAINSKIPHKSMPIKTALKIFDACISPILLYGWCTFLDNDYKKWEMGV